MKKLLPLLLLAALLAGCAAAPGGDYGPIDYRCPCNQAHHGAYHSSDYRGHAAAYHSAHRACCGGPRHLFLPRCGDHRD